MRRRRGFTVIELLVAMLLSALLTTAVYRLLSGGAHLFNKVQSRSNLQDQGLVALSRLASDLRAASWTMLTIEPSPTAVSMGTTGAQSLLVYYFDTVHHTLVRGQAPCTGTRFDTQQLGLFLQQGLTQPVVVARHVVQFAITPATFPTLTAQAEAVHVTLWMSPSDGATNVTPEVVSVASVPRN